MTASVIDPVELVNATRLDHRNATGSCGLVAAWSSNHRPTASLC